MPPVDESATPVDDDDSPPVDESAPPVDDDDDPPDIPVDDDDEEEGVIIGIFDNPLLALIAAGIIKYANIPITIMIIMIVIV